MEDIHIKNWMKRHGKNLDLEGMGVCRPNCLAYIDWSLGNEGSCNIGYTFKDLDI